MSQLNAEKSERTDTTDEEIERMARQRAEIEQELEERQSELSNIGDFDYARCTEFERTEHEAYGRTIPKLQFTFQYPDGTTMIRSFDHEDEPRSVEKFLTEHGAESVTDMIGAKHACIRTDTGWKLLGRQSVRPWTYYQYVFQDGSLLNAHWPSFALSAVTLLSGRFIVEMSGGSGIVGVVLALTIIATFAYGYLRSDYGV